jgi:hypothetical protein
MSSVVGCCEDGDMTNVIDLLSRPVYGLSQVDVLLSLRPGTSRRWIDGYARAGRSYPPVVREVSTGDEAVTWGEFVETRLLAQYRDAGVPMIRMRPAIDVLREQMQTRYPLASARTWLDVDGRELLRWWWSGPDRPSSTGHRPPRPSDDRSNGLTMTTAASQGLCTRTSISIKWRSTPCAASASRWFETSEQRSSSSCSEPVNRRKGSPRHTSSDAKPCCRHFAMSSAVPTARPPKPPLPERYAGRDRRPRSPPLLRG